MEIISLSEVSEVKTGTKNRENNEENGLYPFYTRSQNILKSSEYTIDDEAIIIPGEGIFIPIWHSGKAAVHQRTYIVKSSDNKRLLNKYLYYWWSKNKIILDKSAVGSTVKSLRKFHFLNPKIKLPSILYQLDIIVIIEPFEKLNNQIHKLIQKLKYIYFKIINNFSDSIGFMKDNQILFEKGINFHEAMLSENEDIPFINVSAINNKINKFIKSDYMDKVNTEIGDVMLSLDGNPGLVNNFLWGINGYGYKVISKNNNFSNYQIYFSLLSRINQIIIEKNATGTTIKHATKAKNKLIIFTFNKWNEILELIFFYEIKLKEILNWSNKIINKLIKLFVV